MAEFYQITFNNSALRNAELHLQKENQPFFFFSVSPETTFFTLADLNVSSLDAALFELAVSH